MPKTNWQDPGSSEVRSTHISGLQEAVGKIEDILNMQLQAETNVELSEVYISEQNRYRIFQAPEGKRNWANSPAPVIKKNGVPIASGFVIDYGGGAVIFSTPLSGTDTVTADFSRVKIEGSIIDGLVEVAHDHDNYDVLALLSEDVDGTLLYNGVPIGATPDAGDIPYDNEESELEATKVQGAIDETVDMVKTHKAEKASASALGHVKQGNRIVIDTEGVISAVSNMLSAKGFYNGDGTTRNINIGFTPDLVIIRAVSTTNSLNLFIVDLGTFGRSGIHGMYIERDTAPAITFYVSIVENGFSTGGYSNGANQNGTDYEWIAFKSI